MTDNKIIKALECCAEEKPCNECPLFDYTEDEIKCKNKCFVDALDLINRQRAKIKALEMDNAQLQSDIANANMNSDHALAEIEWLKARNVNNCCNWQIKYNPLRAEAIKEFAERLKKELGFGRHTSYDEIDNLVKEMTEGKE